MIFCDIHQTSISNAEELKEHLKYFHAKESLNCPLCSTYNSTTLKNFMQHFNRHSDIERNKLFLQREPDLSQENSQVENQPDDHSVQPFEYPPDIDFNENGFSEDPMSQTPSNEQRTQCNIENQNLEFLSNFTH